MFFMSATAPVYQHLGFDSNGEPIIARTRFKALHLIREHLAYGWSAEELALNHPQLTLGEIYSTLAWYADHAANVRARIDDELARAGAAHANPQSRRLSRLLNRCTATPM
jgi:uncharacterized protein (DUF433 family)